MGFTPDADRSRPGDRYHDACSIQPHGALLVLDETDTVTHLAGDVRRALGLAPEALLGHPIARLVDREGLPLTEALAGHGARHVAHWHPGAPGQGAWDVTARTTGRGAILEFEPAPLAGRSAGECMAALDRAVAALDSSRSPDELFHSAAEQIRRMTGFERVLVYRFLGDDACALVAQARGKALPSLIDPRHAGPAMPAWEPGRHLGARCLSIPDTHYTPTPLQAAAQAENGATLPDLGDCLLQGTSPEYLRQLEDMGVAAFLSIPLIVDDRPWGLLACHHPVPRPISYELRESCRHVARLVSRQVEAHEEARHRQQGESLRQIHAAWLGGLRRRLDAGHPIDLDLADLADLAGMMPCDGVALVSGARVDRRGHAPDVAALGVLAAWLELPLQRGAFATRQLARELPSAAAYAAEASGVLAIATDTPEPVVLMWFRIGHTSRAGQPDTPPADAARRAPGGTPENRETTHGPACEWTRAEVASARELGHALTSIMHRCTLRELDGRLQAVRQEQQALLAQKHLLMQEVHHRVQNSLQIVNSMLQLQARQTSEPQVRGQFESAVNRLMAVSAVHRHLWRSSDAQNVQLGPYLKELCADLMRSWGDGWSGQVTVAAQDVVIPSHVAVTLALLVTELLTNAAKYAYAGAPGPVAVQVAARDEGLQVVVGDRGLGMPQEVRGSGLGSKLIRIFTAQLGGRVDTQTGTAGTTVTIMVPLAPRGPGKGNHLSRASA